MNFIIRFFSIFSLLIALFFSACAGENEQTVKAVEKLLIKEKIVETVSSSEGGMTVSYADVLDLATPSVVAVYTSKYQRVQSSQMPNGIPDIFRQFGFPVPEIYGEPNAEPEEEKEQLKPYGAGSGVVMTEDGYIVTNHHVVHDQRSEVVDEIRVRFHDGSEFKAELIGSDKKTDVAVLKIDVEDTIIPISVADSELIRVGDVVFAIGNPLEVGITATQGIVSATGRHSLGILGQGAYENFIQTDASINLGNSGGALIDAYGRLIGINTAIFSRTGGSIGIGFAIPVNLVLDVMKKLVETGQVPRGLLGVFPKNISPDLAEAFNLDSLEGALVDEVQEDSPADKAGILHGDIILKVGNNPIKTAQELRLKIAQMSPGDEVLVQLIRDGDLIELSVILGSVDADLAESKSETILDGVTLQSLNSDLRESLSVPESISGVVVLNVDYDSPYARTLAPNAIILEVNGQSVGKPMDIKENLVEGKANRLYVWRNGRIGYIVVKF